MSTVAAPPRSPYKGLSAFDDSDLDALFFFGREREREVIVANLLASRLTVLYGESGVGKSSVLRAGVLRELRRVEPDAFVTLYDSWSQAPSGAALGEAEAEGSGYLILDQLEEYFVYHAHADGPGTLLHDLPQLLRETRVNVLLSLREDALAQLDVFKARIPNVFANHLRLEHLDPAAARAAILGPVERWNELTGEHVAVEPALVAAVLDEVAAGKVDLGGAGLGVAGAASPGRIEAPYLQLVLERIWEAERTRGSCTLRLATLRGLGGAEAIVRTHVENALDELVPEEKDVAARMFDHLVTPSGTKIAQRAGDLAEYAAVPEELVRPVLASLNRERILRTVDGAAGGGERYEIFHDVLAEPVLAWRGRRQLERERFAAARRSRRLLAVALVSVVALLAVAAVAAFGLAQRNSARGAAHHAHARELQATALQQLSVDPEQSLLLALDAARLEPSSAAEDVLRQALLASRLRLVLPERKSVDAVAYSPDGKQIAAGSTDGRVSVFDAATGRLLRVLRDSGAVVAIAYSPDGAQLLTAGADTEAVLWNAHTGARLRTMRATAPITNAAFSPNGSEVIVSSLDAAARIWDARDGRLVSSLRTGGDPARARVSPDGSLAVVVAADRELHVHARVYDARTGQLLHTLPEKGITDAEFSPNGRLLATTSADDTTRLWEPRSGRLLRLLDDGGGTVLAASFSPDGTLLATAGQDGAVRIWTVADGTRLFFFPAHTGYVGAVAWSPDGHVVASASLDRTVRLWAVQGLVEDGTLIAILAGHRGGVDAIAFSPNGRRLVSGSTDGTARVWDARAEQELDLLGRAAGEVVRARWSPDGTLVVSADADGTARIWAVGTHRLLQTLQHGGGAVNDAEFSPDGTLVVTAGVDGDARIWDVAGGSLVRTLDHGAAVSVASFDQNGRDVVTAGADGVARIWDVGNGRLRVSLRGHGALVDAAFSPDGMLLATASTEGATEWSLPSGRPLHVLPLVGGAVRVAFSPDGKLLATAGADPVVRLWDAASGRLVHALRGHRGAVTDVEFSRDGTTLATSSADTDGRLWDVASGRPLHVLRGHFGPVAAIGLSPDGRWAATAGPISAGLWPTATGRLLFYLRGDTSLLTSISFAPDGRRILSSSRDGTVRVYTCEVCGNLQALVTLADQRVERTAHALTPAQRARYLPAQ